VPDVLKVGMAEKEAVMRELTNPATWESNKTRYALIALVFIGLAAVIISLLAPGLTTKPTPVALPKILSEEHFVSTGEVVLFQTDSSMFFLSSQQDVVMQWEKQNPDELLLNCEQRVVTALQCEIFKRKGG
jgi:hypothetical protein